MIFHLRGAVIPGGEDLIWDIPTDLLAPGTLRIRARLGGWELNLIAKDGDSRSFWLTRITALWWSI